MFNSVYYTSFKLQLESSGINVPNTQNFMDCVKNNFSTPETQNILNYRFRILEPRINFLFRLIIALKTSDHILEMIMDHVLSSDCGDALLQLTHCKECSGSPSSTPSCTQFCWNVLRGCLVDLTEVGNVLQEYATAL